jgi:hypothetical protein
MKKMQILAMVSFLVLGLTSLAGAMLAVPPAEDPFTEFSDPARFLVINNFGDVGDGEVNLVVQGYTFPAGTLQYKYGESDWLSIAGYAETLHIDTGADLRELVYFRFLLSPEQTITDASMTFSGYDAPFYNSVSMLFGPSAPLPGSSYGSVAFAVGTPDKGNHVAPAPIPGAVWLLGSGMFGLFGIRKKMTA